MGRRRNLKKKDEANLFQSELFTCEESEILGRYLKAKVDIREGTIILREKCLVAGPKTSSKAICVGCHSDLVRSPARFSCSKCGWPVCTKKCEESPFHAVECPVFTKRNIMPPTDLNSRDYGAIAVLRALLLKANSPQDWKKLIALQHHNEERKVLRVWEQNRNAVKVIRETWGFADLYSEEEIFSICGIYEVNGFEMGDFNVFGGIYPISAMIAHDCVPNAGHFENLDERVLEIITLTNIPAGSPLTMCYDCSLKGTDIRRKQLKKSKYFDCLCKRCLDVSEIGTNFSTLICENANCKRGNLVKKSLHDPTWECKKCSKVQTAEEIEHLLSKYESISEGALSTIKAKEEFLIDTKDIFHPNHFIPFSVKFSLCMAYGHDVGYTLYELTQAEAHRKLELCQEVLKVLNVLTPGLTTSRGNILYELQAAEVLISRNLLESGKCSKALIKRRLQNTLKTLEEAIRIFELSYPMRLLAESAKATTLMEVKSFINSLR